MMAARARVLADPGVDVLRAMTAQAQRAGVLDPGNVGAPSVGALYAGTLAAAKLREFALARSLANVVKNAVEGNADASWAAGLLLTEVDLLAGTVPTAFQAIDISKTARRAELLTQSRALLAAGKPQEVSSRLATWVTDKPKDSAAWQLLAVAYGNQGQAVRAIRADAESHAAKLDYPAAIDRLKAAQNMMRSNPASGDFMESSIIDTRTRQLELLVKQQALDDKLDR